MISSLVTTVQNAGQQIDVTSWAQWGVLGLVILAIVVFKQLVPGYIYNDLKEENKKLKEENKELVDRLLRIGETAFPAIKESNEMVKKAMDELREMKGPKT